MSGEITAKILRFDPSADEAPHYETYEVPWIEDESNIVSALQVLDYIDKNIEPIAYDSSCFSSICGRCAMLIDGKPGLACVTPLMPGEHTLEPLRGFPVLRDLMVDTSKGYDQFVDSKMENQTVEEIAWYQPFDYDFYWEVLDRLNTCRECMCCYAACPALNEEGKWGLFVGPGAMMQIGMRYLDGRDQSDRILQAVTSGLFQCTMCGECAEVCSSHIDILGVMQLMRTAAEQRGMKPSNAAEVDYGITGKAPQLSYDGTNVVDIVGSGQCSMPQCHDSTLLESYQRDAELANLRVESHVKKKATITDAQSDALKKFFTKS